MGALVAKIVASMSPLSVWMTTRTSLTGSVGAGAAVAVGDGLAACCARTGMAKVRASGEQGTDEGKCEAVS